jgi:hypothetical protein
MRQQGSKSKAGLTYSQENTSVLSGAHWFEGLLHCQHPIRSSINCCEPPSSKPDCFGSVTATETESWNRTTTENTTTSSSCCPGRSPVPAAARSPTGDGWRQTASPTLSYSIRPSLEDARRHPASITNGTSCFSESSRPVRTRNNPPSPSFHLHYAALPKTHIETEDGSSGITGSDVVKPSLG